MNRLKPALRCEPQLLQEIWGGAPTEVEFGAFSPENVASGSNNCNHFRENQLTKFNAVKQQ